MTPCLRCKVGFCRQYPAHLSPAFAWAQRRISSSISSSRPTSGVLAHWCAGGACPAPRERRDGVALEAQPRPARPPLRAYGLDRGGGGFEAIRVVLAPLAAAQASRPSQAGL